jgi:Fic family protein
MRRLNPFYIHQLATWPNFTWDKEAIWPVLAELKHKQGRLKGTMDFLGFALRDETTLQTLTMDVIKSSEIEGEILNLSQVRSSIARKLGIEIAGLVPADRHVDGVVEMMLDASQNYRQVLNKERLCAWHSALFPAGRSGLYKITVGDWRNNANGPMQVVSGAMGKEKVHFEAPEANRLDKEMRLFLKWFNKKDSTDPVLKSALAHFWFVTIHPFDDGNGRIARAIADMQLARSDGDVNRYYSMSTQIRVERKLYYEMLEKNQKGNLDITTWLLWYFNCLDAAFNATDKIVKRVLSKTKFWDKHAKKSINARQRLLLNKLLDGFEGKLNSSKWAKIAKCSTDTALRDIQDLMQKKMLKQEEGGGRSTSYKLKH